MAKEAAASLARGRPGALALLVCVLVAGCVTTRLDQPRADATLWGEQLLVQPHGCDRWSASVSIDGERVGEVTHEQPWVRSPSAAKHELAVEGRCDGRELRARTAFTVIDASPNAIAGSVADHFAAKHPAARLPWDWGPGILTLGMARLGATDPAGHRARLDYVAIYHRTHDDPRIRRPDHYAPALSAVELLRMGYDEGRGSVKRVAGHLAAAPRNRLGALDHLAPGTLLGRLYPASIWVDSLTMVGLTAAGIGEVTQDVALQQWAREQPVIFARHLQDPATGLFRHAYLYERDRVRPRDACFWLRGNGWVAMTLVDLLERMDPDDAQRAPLVAIFDALMEGLRATRRPDGLWNTVIGRANTYAEPSGSALVAYAMAKGARLGLLPPSAHREAAQTFHTLAAQLRPHRGGLSMPKISGPTIPGGCPAYAAVPRRADLGYGVGALALLAAELGLAHGST